MSTKQVVFQDWDSWLAHVSQPCPDDASNRSAVYRPGYHYTPDYETALDLAKRGWHDAEADARKLTKVISKEIGSLVEQDVELYDVEGAGVDVQMFAQGIPECWLRNDQKFAQAPGPIVKVVFNFSADWRVRIPTLITRGASVAGLIECIELSGRSVELWATMVLSYWETSWETRIKVKDAGQPLDLGRMMFAIAHPDALRRLGLRDMELNPDTRPLTMSDALGSRVIRSEGWYGVPVDVPEDGDRGDIYIPAITVDRSEQATRQWIVEKLREQGIEVNDEALNAKPIEAPEQQDLPPIPLDYIPGGEPVVEDVRDEELDDEADALDKAADELDAETDELDTDEDDGEVGIGEDEDSDIEVPSSEGEESEDGLPQLSPSEESEEEGEEEGDSGEAIYHNWGNPEWSEAEEQESEQVGSFRTNGTV